MRKVTADEWAAHCARFRTYSTEQTFRTVVSWMSTHVSELAPNRLQESAPAHALVGRVEYRPDGTRVYFIF